MQLISLLFNTVKHPYHIISYHIILYFCECRRQSRQNMKYNLFDFLNNSKCDHGRRTDRLKHERSVKGQMVTSQWKTIIMLNAIWDYTPCPQKVSQKFFVLCGKGRLRAELWTGAELLDVLSGPLTRSHAAGSSEQASSADMSSSARRCKTWKGSPVFACRFLILPYLALSYMQGNSLGSHLALRPPC